MYAQAGEFAVAQSESIFRIQSDFGVCQSIAASMSPHETEIGCPRGRGDHEAQVHRAVQHRPQRARTKKNPRGCPVELVLGRAFPESDHIDLLQRLKRLPCRVVLSGCPPVSYDQVLPAGAASIRS